MREIKVLLAEDSSTVRELLVEILERDASIRVVAQAANGTEAVELTERIGPDIVVMDVYMPELDGLEATKRIMARTPTPIVVVSSRVRDELDLSLSATQAGALLVLPKPIPGEQGYEEERDHLVRMVKAMSDVKVVRRWGGGSSTPARPLDPPGRRIPTGVVAVGASTGGPAALRRLLVDLPPDFEAPLVVVQHMARGFTRGFVDWLSRGCGLRVQLAAEGEPLEPAVVYVAPDDHHMGVTREGRVQLSETPPVEGFRPSATFLFESVAASYGTGVVAVVLTGMGSDGVRGLAAVRRAGGRVIAQDEASSIVYGMAREAVERGLVQELLPLEQVAARLVETVGRADV